MTIYYLYILWVTTGGPNSTPPTPAPYETVEACDTAGLEVTAMLMSRMGLKAGDYKPYRYVCAKSN